MDCPHLMRVLPPEDALQASDSRGETGVHHRRRTRRGVGRAWAYVFLGAMFVAVAYVHGVWLPRHGINGWTGEPRDRYLELVTRPHRRSSRA